jgi:hypothetical protein
MAIPSVHVLATNSNPPLNSSTPLRRTRTDGTASLGQRAARRNRLEATRTPDATIPVLPTRSSQLSSALAVEPVPVAAPPRGTFVTWLLPDCADDGAGAADEPESPVPVDAAEALPALAKVRVTSLSVY